MGCSGREVGKKPRTGINIESVTAVHTGGQKAGTRNYRPAQPGQVLPGLPLRNWWVTGGRGWAEKRTSRSTVPRRMGVDEGRDLTGFGRMPRFGNDVAYVITTTGL